MNAFLIDITVAAAIVIAGRIITFQRRGSRYRPGIAWLAWLVTCVNFTLIFKLPVHTPPEPITAILALWQVAFAVLLLRNGGNLAHLIRQLRAPRRQ